MALSEILACPVCHAAMAAERCGNCGRAYGRLGAVLDLTPVPVPDAELERSWSLWEALQENGERAYEFDPPSSLSVGKRDDARAFADFSELRGRVLDVGCGPQKLPSYAAGFEGEFVGIDPLLGAQPREFEFVKGLAEYLPFAAGSFDRVLFATSIDHMLSPSMSLASAARVTKPGGIVSVWLGEAPPRRSRKSVGYLLRALKPRPRTAEVHTYAGKLELGIPQGAIDPFHVEHPTVEKVIGWLDAAALEVEEIDRAFPGSCFVRARRGA